MSKRRNIETLKDIMEAIKRIEIYNKGLNYRRFLQDIKTQDATVRNIEIIGEAVKNLSKDLKEKYNEIQWKDIAGMRDKIIHFYFGVKWEIVWSVIKNDIPQLKKNIEKIIKSLEEQKLNKNVKSRDMYSKGKNENI